MKKQTQRFAPLCVIFGFVSWCCWQSLEKQEPFNLSDQNVVPPSIKRADLEPVVRGHDPRDPFAIVKTRTAPQSIDNDSTILTSVTANPAVDLTDTLSSLKLNATYVRGDRRLAMINSRTFQEGDTCDALASLDESGTIALVQHDAVVLDVRGQKYRLSYDGLALLPPAGDDEKPASAASRSLLRSFLRILPIKSPHNATSK